MSNQQRAKGQHYVPRFYLAHFSGRDPPGHVWSYGKESKNPTHALPEETAKQTNFYSMQKEDGSYDDSVDEWLQGIEDRAAPPYERLIRGEIPKDQDRASLSGFLATMMLRTPAMLQVAGQIIGSSFDHFSRFAGTPERIEKRLKEIEANEGAIDPEVRALVLERAANPGDSVIEVPHEATLQMILGAEKIEKIFFGMGWMVVDGDGQFFVTSDNPVSVQNPREDFSPIYGDGRLMNKRVQVTLPLSPSRLLLLMHREDRPGVFKSPRESTRASNRARAADAYRFVYSDRRDAGIAALLDKVKGKGHFLKVEGGPPDASPVVVKRKPTRRPDEKPPTPKATSSEKE